MAEYNKNYDPWKDRIDQQRKRYETELEEAKEKFRSSSDDDADKLQELILATVRSWHKFVRL